MPDPSPLAPLSDEELEELRETLATRVREAREEAELTTGDVARAHGKTAQWVRGMESGLQWPPAWYLATLARHAQRSVAWFFGQASDRKSRRGGK